MFLVIFIAYLLFKRGYWDDVQNTLEQIVDELNWVFLGKGKPPEEREEATIITTTTVTIQVSNSKITKIKELLEEYHKTHTYSLPDLFVCEDMAIEFWNILETNGFNAKIAVGNIDKENADISEYNHAWVLVEVEPFKYLACEVTGGYIVYYENNPNYYKYPSFDNPAEFKKFRQLREKYFEILWELENLKSRYNYVYNEYKQAVSEYNDMVDYWNNYCAGKPLYYDSCLEYNRRLEEKSNEVNYLKGVLDSLSYQIQEEENNLNSLVSQIEALYT